MRKKVMGVILACTMSVVILLMIGLTGCGAKQNDLFNLPQEKGDVVNPTDYPLRTDAIVVGERGDYPQLEKERMILKNLDKDSYGYINVLFWLGEDRGYCFYHSRIAAIDYETGDCIPVCNRPNCSHKSGVEGCMAKFYGMDGETELINGVYCYQDHLYVITYDFNRTYAYRTDLDGSNHVLLDSIPLLLGSFDCYYSGCLFGLGQSNTGAMLSINGVRYSETVNYLVCFSAEDGKFHVISDKLLNYNGNYYVNAIEERFVFYTKSFFEGQVATSAEEFWEGDVCEYYRYDLSTGDTVKLAGSEAQFQEEDTGFFGGREGIMEIGLKNWLLVGMQDKFGIISRDAAMNGGEPIEIKY